jgi:hypothetical protein
MDRLLLRLGHQSPRRGKDAAHDFWLLTQHQTPAIQRRLLSSLEVAAKSGDAAMTDYVYLYDRVQIGLDQLQRWGSQIKYVAGKPALYPVDDPGDLDARRKELSLMAIDEYLKTDPLAKACAVLQVKLEVAPLLFKKRRSGTTLRVGSSAIDFTADSSTAVSVR